MSCPMLERPGKPAVLEPLPEQRALNFRRWEMAKDVAMMWVFDGFWLLAQGFLNPDMLFFSSKDGKNISGEWGSIHQPLLRCN